MGSIFFFIFLPRVFFWCSFFSFLSFFSFPIFLFTRILSMAKTASKKGLFYFGMRVLTLLATNPFPAHQRVLFFFFFFFLKQKKIVLFFDLKTNLLFFLFCFNVHTTGSHKPVHACNTRRDCFFSFPL